MNIQLIKTFNKRNINTPFIKVSGTTWPCKVPTFQEFPGNTKKSQEVIEIDVFYNTILYVREYL